MKNTNKLNKKELLNLINVVGHSEDEDQVTVFVTKKLKMPTIEKKIRNPLDTFTTNDIIPKTIVVTGKIPFFKKKKKTTVIEIGNVKIHTNRKKYRPLIGGCEIGPYSQNWVGTLGMFVKIKHYRGLYLTGLWYSFISILEKFGLKTSYKIMALTNSHVVNTNVTLPAKLLITQPGSMPYLTIVIGKTLISHPIKRYETNTIDSALINIDPNPVGSQYNNEILEIGKISGFDNVKVGDQCKKYGRTTELTEGKCISKNITITIDYGEPLGLIKFTGIDMYGSMSADGDSGAVIIRKNDNAAVGHLFAGSNSITLAVPILKIKNYFKFELA